MRTLAALLVALSLLAAGCAGDDDEGAPEADGAPTGTSQAPSPEAGAFAFTGGDVSDGQPVDPLHTCDGRDVSPALVWEGVPEGTAELVLVVEDPDAPGGTFVHWLAYAVPPDQGSIPRGVPPGQAVSGDLVLRQGENDLGFPGYGGPCPPEGETHDYVFRLLALDEESGLEGGASHDEVLAATEGRVLGEATLTAPYARQ